MKCYKQFLWLVAISFLLTACSGSSVEPEPNPTPDPPRALTSAEKVLASTTSDFGLSLFKALVQAEPDTNLFISPLSVALALGMAYNGADGTTREAMATALSVAGMTDAEINEAYRSLMAFLTGLDQKVQFDIANSIWYREGFSVLPEFQTVNKTYFDALVRGLDFDREDAPDTINAWVSRNTNDRIKEIVDGIPPYIVMYLINAVYFNGTWTYEFDPKQTEPESFFLSDGSVLTVPMMKQEATFPVYRGEGFMSVRLPYGDRAFNMTILLPDDTISVNHVIQRLDKATWVEWNESFVESDVLLSMPKYQLEYAVDLKQALTVLGMGVAFEAGNADFSRISAAGDLFISGIKHKTFLKVDEEGTEAAAVTSIEIGIVSIPEIILFRVNRPFLVVLTEKHSNAILFIGKIMRPVS